MGQCGEVTSVARAGPLDGARGHAHQVRWKGVKDSPGSDERQQMKQFQAWGTPTFFPGWMPPKCSASQSGLWILDSSRSENCWASSFPLQGPCWALQNGFPLSSDPANAVGFNRNHRKSMEAAFKMGRRLKRGMSVGVSYCTTVIYVSNGCLTRRNVVPMVKLRVSRTWSRIGSLANTRKETSCIASTCREARSMSTRADRYTVRSRLARWHVGSASSVCHCVSTLFACSRSGRRTSRRMPPIWEIAMRTV